LRRQTPIDSISRSAESLPQAEHAAACNAFFALRLLDIRHTKLSA
jgi:hypothetical protein